MTGELDDTALAPPTEAGKPVSAQSESRSHGDEEHGAHIGGVALEETWLADRQRAEEPGLGQRPQVARSDKGKQFSKAKLRAALFGHEAPQVEVDRFVLLGRLGAGAMGEVYTAYDERLDRKVALKLVRGSDGERNADDRLLREAQTLARLSHPNVVQVYEAGAVDGRVFIAMEYVRGQTLTRWLESVQDLSRRERVAAILSHFVAAGRGLQAAHEAGLAHRDFKPDNVLVGDDDRVRVVDFGLARMIEGDASDDTSPDDPPGNDDGTPKAALSLTATGAVIGTPAYMAPEQFHGQLADARSDQFSFCVALHEALYGERPFHGVSYQELRSAVTRGVIEGRGATRTLEVPEYLRRALRQGLAVDADERHPSMGALIDILEGVSRRRQRRFVLAAIVLVVLLAGALVYSSTRQPAAAPVCQGARAEIGQIWTEDAREHIARTIEGTGRAYATEAWPIVAAGLDRYANDWSTTHEQACLAHQRGHQSSELLDRRMVCLARRKNALTGAPGLAE